MTIDTLLRGGYLRLPMSLTVAVVTLRALCREREEAGTSSRFDRQQKKRGSRCFTSDSLLRGGYLLSHFRSTIGVVRLNFSVRNGKRWDPHAMIGVVRLNFSVRNGKRWDPHAMTT